MKRMGLWLGGAIVLALAVALYMAGQMGETTRPIAAGVVKVRADLIEKTEGIKTLFLIVSSPDSPMPIGALSKTLKKGVEGEVVFHFNLNRDNVQFMDPNRPLPDKVRIKARLDRDSQGGPDQPYDLVGILEDVPLGTTDLTLVIDRLIDAD